MCVLQVVSESKEYKLILILYNRKSSIICPMRLLLKSNPLHQNSEIVRIYTNIMQLQHLYFMPFKIVIKV